MGVEVGDKSYMTDDQEKVRQALKEHAAKTISPRKLLIEEGLYQEHDQSELQGGNIRAFREHLRFDAYCPQCKQNATFARLLTEQDQEEQRRAAAMAASIHSGRVGSGRHD